MKINEVTRKKKIINQYDPYEQAWYSLERLKEQGEVARPNNSLQLFVPRPQLERFTTKKERENHLLKDRAKYAYDDEGQFVPQYQQWVNSATESIFREGAPIIAGGSPVLSSGNKPVGALLWTSTAKEINGKYTSDWWKYVLNGGVENKYKNTKIGYLYKVKPRTCSLEIDTTNDARFIYEIFYELGRGNTRYKNPSKEDENFIRNFGDSYEKLIVYDFPWDQIQRHFDCVHHWGGSRIDRYFYRFNFTDGYDVESTVWLKPDKLELLGQVQLINEGEQDENY